MFLENFLIIKKNIDIFGKLLKSCFICTISISIVLIAKLGRILRPFLILLLLVDVPMDPVNFDLVYN